MKQYLNPSVMGLYRVERERERYIYIYIGYIGIMEKEMEASTMGLYLLGLSWTFGQGLVRRGPRKVLHWKMYAWTRSSRNQPSLRI